MEHEAHHNVNGHEESQHPETKLDEIVDAVKTFVRDMGDTITGEDHHGSKPASRRESVTEHIERRVSTDKGHQDERRASQTGDRHESLHETVTTTTSGSRRESLAKEHPEARRSSKAEEVTQVRDDSAGGEPGIIESAYNAAKDGVNDMVEAVQTFVRDATGSDEQHGERRRSSVADGYSGHVQPVETETETQVRPDRELVFDVSENGQIAWSKEDLQSEASHDKAEFGHDDAFLVLGNGRIEWPQHEPRVGDSLEALVSMPSDSFSEGNLTERRRSSVADGYHGQTQTRVIEDSDVTFPPPLMEPPLAVGCPADMFLPNAGLALAEHRHGFHTAFHQPVYRETNVRDDVDEKHCAICSDDVVDDHVALHDKHFHRNCFDTVYSGTCTGCGKHIHVTEESVSVGALRQDWHGACFKCHSCNNPIRGDFQLRDGNPLCDNCYRDNFAPHCVACNGPIEGNKLKAMSGYWHPNCFVCSVCGEALFLVGSGVEYFNVKGKPYCRKDVEEAHIQIKA